MSKKKIGVAMSVVLACGIVTGAQASSVLEEVKAFVNKEIKFEINGKQWYPSNEIITYDNSTYLPVRAISEALNVVVDYEHDTRTIYLGEKAEGIPLLDSVDISTDHTASVTKDPSKTTYFGSKYDSVVSFTRMSAGLSSDARFNLDENYQKLVLNVATTTEARIKVIDRESKIELLDTSFTSKDQVKELTIDVAGVKTLLVEMRSKSNEGVAILSTSYLK